MLGISAALIIRRLRLMRLVFAAVLFLVRKLTEWKALAPLRRDISIFFPKLTANAARDDTHRRSRCVSVNKVSIADEDRTDFPKPLWPSMRTDSLACRDDS